MAVVAGLAALALAGCGGGSKGDTTEPTGGGEEEEGAASGGEDTLIPEEKYEEIRHTFERKTSSVSRCYVEGFEAGEVEKTEKGHVTVGLTINLDGKPSNVRVLESSFSSKKVGECVVRLVEGWIFTTLPKPLDTSHTYVLDRL